jgi:hypothetical protein
MPRLRARTQAENANQHTPHGLGLLETSIGQDGWIDAITVAADDESISGSARIEIGAAKGWDFAHEEPLVIQAPADRPLVVETDGSQPLIHRRIDIPTANDPRARRLSVAANQITAVDWAPDAELLARWADDDARIKALFTEESWAAMLAGVPAPDIGGAGDDFDGTPQTEGPTRTALGDLWHIGPHRLIVGDCTDPAVVARLMGGERADILINDPPYGMRLDASYANSATNGLRHIPKSRGYGPVTGDDEDYDPTPIMALFKDAKEQFWWGADYYRQYLPAGGSWFVWDKRAGMTDFEYTLSEFELCWSRTQHQRQILRVRWFGAFGTETQDTKVRIHPTQKPLQVYTELLEKYSPLTGLIIDTYLGSGTAVIAAHKAGRRCYGCEIEPRYADVVLRRAEAAGLTCTLHTI